MNLFEILGFTWDRSAASSSFLSGPSNPVCHQFFTQTPELVWVLSRQIGLPFKLEDVKTLADGITVGGYKIAQHEKILNLLNGFKHLLWLVDTEQFTFTPDTLMSIVKCVEPCAVEGWGWFAGDGEAKCARAISALNDYVFNPFERAVAFFLYVESQQFFFDGNRPAAYLMMNGILMSHGIYAVQMPNAQVKAFNEHLVRFHFSRDASDLMRFFCAYHLEQLQHIAV